MIDENNVLIIDMGMAIRVPYTDPKNPPSVTDITRGTQRRLILPQGTCGKVSLAFRNVGFGSFCSLSFSLTFLFYDYCFFVDVYISYHI